MPESSTPDPTLDHLDFLLSSFPDTGQSLSGFVNNPQEPSICILTAGFMSTSKFMLSPAAPIQPAFDHPDSRPSD